MKAATIRQLKEELNHLPKQELVDVCLRIAKFKKDNKELLSYLLFESNREDYFIENIKHEIDEMFDEINKSSYYYIKKSVRKIQRHMKKHIQYSKKKETEVELLLYFCFKLKRMSPSITGSSILMNIYNRQIEHIQKVIGTLHEDLQFDYNSELEKFHLT